jgi:hypothetical protein
VSAQFAAKSILEQAKKSKKTERIETDFRFSTFLVDQFKLEVSRAFAAIFLGELLATKFFEIFRTNEELAMESRKLLSWTALLFFSILTIIIFTANIPTDDQIAKIIITTKA